MIVEFDKSFSKSLDKITDRNLLSRIENAILKLESAKSVEEIANNKKLTGFTNYYRIKLGDYRMGYERIDGRTVRLITVAHRKDIYKRFP
ncbi:MAG: type II toxin-antitoxin system mRNA interferase toxin, RelE/StbE family [Saprospiraceae bacterium]|nr:type II toxin-antitoxin system mRNA interferase toxin, RelE/StbE family [Saprospiraceae bacterium]